MSSEPDFGLDLSCSDDVDPHGATVNGYLALAQALVRRLDTAAGLLVGDTGGEYGRSLADRLSEGATAGELDSEGSLVRAQFLADERVRRATVSLVRTGEKLTLTCRVVSFDGPFTFVVDATGAGLLLRAGSVEEGAPEP